MRECLRWSGAWDSFDVRTLTAADIDLRCDVAHSDRVGMDRLVTAQSSVRRFGSPVIVVDAGSAITVDLIDRRATYRGGAILPGLRLQTLALTREITHLPTIDWREPLIGELPRPAATRSRRSGWAF